MSEMRPTGKNAPSKIKFRIIKGRPYNAGDKKPLSIEKRIEEARFHIHKFNNRHRPTDPRRILIICCFSEFGSEIIGNLYCIPRLISLYPGTYVICVGWHGRDYLYRHLADEYWELGEEYQWLREYSRAFHHVSRNLMGIEKKLRDFGRVSPSRSLGAFCIGNCCKNCKHSWHQWISVKTCVKCGSAKIESSLYGNIREHKSSAIPIPRPGLKKMEEVRKYLKPNTVGVFARDRRCYGRNLQPEFYEKLVNLLEQMGYNLIWLGEKQSTLPPPKSHIVDFRGKDMESVLAIISQLEFTVQFWTASTRLASIMKVPFLLFESLDQMMGRGQERIRMALTTDIDKQKIVLAHFLDIYENHDLGLNLVKHAVEEMKENIWQTLLALRDTNIFLKQMVKYDCANERFSETSR